MGIFERAELNVKEHSGLILLKNLELFLPQNLLVPLIGWINMAHECIDNIICQHFTSKELVTDFPNQNLLVLEA